MGKPIAFVRACLDRVEQVATEAKQDGGGCWTYVKTEGGRSKVVDELGYSVSETEDVDTGPWWTQPHIALHDPASVLAGVAAKRAILELHGPCCNDSWCTNKGCATCDRYNTGFKVYPCKTLILLTQEFAGWDGWQEEWRL